MNPPPTYVALAIQAANAHGLDPAIVCAICEVESSWRPWAIRWEPGFYMGYIADLEIETVPPCTEVTERHTRAFSFGLMQVIGQVARELGFGGMYLSELCDPEVGLDYGCIKLRRCYRLHPASIEDAIAAYNGKVGTARTLAYASKVLRAAEHYRRPA